MSNDLKEVTSKVKEIVLLLDASGSMNSIKESVIEHYNGFLAQQLNDWTEDKITRQITLFTFNSTQAAVHIAANLTELEMLTAYNYKPIGGTALYDAICTTISAVMTRVTAPSYAFKPNSVIMVIITDGEENESRTYDKTATIDIIDRCKQAGWDFVFLGANMDAFAVGRNLGVQASVSWAATDAGVLAAFATTSKNVTQTARGK